MRKVKRLALIISLVGLLMCVLCFCASAGDHDPLGGFPCINGVSYSIDGDGVACVRGLCDGYDIQENKVHEPFAELVIPEVVALPTYDETSYSYYNKNYTVVRVSDYAFQFEKNIRKVVLPNTVERIGWFAFEGCSSLEEIILSEKITVIGDNAFRNCNNIKEIYLTKNITYIGTEALSMTGLKTATIDFKKFSSDTFKNGAFLNPEKIILTKNVEIIDINHLFGLNNIEYVEVNEENAVYCDVDGVLFTKDKKHLAFYPPKKSNVEYVVPDTVEKIGSFCFSCNENLKELYISSNIKVIEDYALFAHQITDIYFDGTQAQWNDINKGVNSFTGVTIHYKDITTNDPPTPDDPAPKDPDEPDTPIIPTEPEKPDINEHEHSYDDDEDETCNGCGFDRAENCSCDCHAGGFKAFFFKLINFFAKLFNPSKKVCACGMKH